MRTVSLLGLTLWLGACSVQLENREGRACDAEHLCESGRVCERKECVTGVAVSTLSVVPGALRMIMDDELILAPFARDATGLQLHHRLVRFVSRNPSVATVSAGGRVRAIAPGQTELEVHADDRSVVVPVRVDPPALAANVFVDPAGSDDGICLTDTPCATLDRAYRVANPGQVVELRSGHYPLQTIQERTSAGGEPILFRSAKDASVVIDELTVEAANVGFRELTIGQLDVHPSAHDSTYFRVQISGGGFGNEGADRVAILGSTIGPGNPNEYSITSAGRDFNLSTSRLTGYANDDARGCCGTCLVVSSGDGVALRANRFDRCADVAIEVAVWGEGGPPRNVLVENSFLQVDADGRGTSIGVGEVAPDSVLVRNNSMSGAVEFAAASEPSRFEVFGNIGLGPHGCPAGATFRQNLWETDRCDGAPDLAGVPHFRDLAAYDLHLLPTSPGIDALLPNDAPVEDIDGEPRPSGAGVEIGADER